MDHRFSSIFWDEQRHAVTIFDAEEEGRPGVGFIEETLAHGTWRVTGLHVAAVVPDEQRRAAWTAFPGAEAF